MPLARSALALFIVCGCANASLRPVARDILPLQRLRLYETGIGYFERAGKPPASASTTLPVPAGHLDDALKTLVVLSPGGKTGVRGVAFASSVSRGMARALAGLDPSTPERLGWRDVLRSLRGATVEVRTGKETVRGRLVEVVTDGNEPTLLLLSETSELRRLPGRAVVSVRPTDPERAAQLGTALDALSTHAARGTQAVGVLATGSEAITLGYVAEAPVYRPSYRLLLEPQKARLQGFALVHNDTEEDWRGIRLELVNGEPASFLHPMAAPRYARRELLEPVRTLATVPQLLGTTADALWGDHTEGTEEGLIGLGEVGSVGHGGGGVGYGRGAGALGGRGITTTVGASGIVSVGDLAHAANATATETGALFLYAMPEPVTLPARHSGLLAFLDRGVDAVPITWFDGPGHQGEAGVRLVNDSGQTLPAGPVALFSEGGFVGEAMLPRLRPGERSFVRHGADLDLEVRAGRRAITEEVRRVRLMDETLEQHFVRTTRVAWTVENRSGLPRTAMVRLDIVKNARVEGVEQVELDEASGRPVARLTAPARSVRERALVVVERLERKTPVSSLDAETLRKLGAALGPESRAPLEAAARATEAARDATRKKADAERELGRREADIERLRKSLEATRGERRGPESALVSRVLAAEDALVRLRDRSDALDGEIERHRRAVKDALSPLK